MKTILEYGGIALLSLFLMVKGILPGWNSVHSDFGNYYVASRLLVEGADLQKLYDNDWFQRQIHDHGIQQQGKFAPFPPATAWIMLPLTPFEPLTAQRIWTFLNLLFLGVNLILIKKITSWPWRSCALFVLLSGWGLANNFAFGQVYLVLSGFLLWGYRLIQKNRSVLAGIVFAFFAAVKYFPVIYFPGYFLTKHYRFIVSAVLALISLFVLQGVVFGKVVMLEFITRILFPHLDGNLLSQGQFAWQYQSWDSFLRFLFVLDPVNNPDPFFAWSPGRVLFKLIVYLLVFGATALVLWTYRTTAQAIRVPLFLAVPALAALALLPVSATYHFVLFYFPLALLFSTGLFAFRERALLLTLYGLTGFIPYSIAFAMAKQWGLFFAFPRLWLVSLLFIVVVISLQRNFYQRPVPVAP